jgi:dTDP-4-dehydrorhamnose reductase
MILMFGSHGQVGQALVEQLGEIPEHVFLYRESRDYCGDLNDTAGITETLMELRPEIIINAAAYTAVDRAESEPEIAEKINAKAPAAIAQVAARLGSLLIHYSTDYVFDGSGSQPWKETDVCKPLSVYGRGKRAGEEAVMAAGGRHYILRTSWVYGRHGKNFLKTMLQLADMQSSINVVNDQWGVPTSADYLADVTLALIDRSTAGLGAEFNTPPAFGIYHCAPAGETTWFDYACLAINHAKACGAAQACTQINPIPTSAYPTAAQRPLNSRLDTRKLSAALGHAAPDWQEGVIQTVGELLNQPQE